MEFYTDDNLQMYIAGDGGLNVLADNTTSNVFKVGTATGFPASTHMLHVDNIGFVGIGTNTAIGTEKLNVGGHIFPSSGAFDLGFNSMTNTWRDVYGINAYTATSDLRAKTNIKPLSYGLNEILKLKTHTYQWKTNPNGTRIGFISQEVLEVIPEVVVVPTTDEGAYMMRYSELIPVLVNAIQEQQQQINELSIPAPDATNTAKEISDLKKENEVLKAQMNELYLQFQNLCELPCIQELQNRQTGTLIDKALLEQNTPNPFNENTEIRYYLPKSAVSSALLITNTEGKTIQAFTLNGIGNGTLTLNAGTLAAGTYFYTLVVNGQTIDTKKMLIVKN